MGDVIRVFVWLDSQTHVVLQEDGYDPYRLPYWIRASFIMEERWGELEAEFNAAKDAVQLAEEWGVVRVCASCIQLLPADSTRCPCFTACSAASAFGAVAVMSVGQ